MTTTPTDDNLLRRTALYERHLAHGARMVPFAGWEMPVQYAGVMDEHRAVRSAAGLFDVSHMGEFRVSGEGAEAFLQRLTPNNVAKLKVGRAHYSALLDERGRYLDDLLVYRLGGSEFMLVVNAANRESDLAWVESHCPPDATVEDISDDTALLALQGPRSVELLGRLTGSDLAGIRYYGFEQGEVAGRKALLSRTGYTGEDGFELYLAPEDAPEVWDALIDEGAESGLVPAGLGARDTLRLEAGMALYGHELDATTTPWEARLDWTVKLDKGDFLGMEALVEQREAGVDHLLAGFEVTGRGIAREGSPVFSGDARVGKVTSGTFSPTFEKALGIARVEAASAAAGTEVELEVRGRRIPARVVELPFYRRA